MDNSIVILKKTRKIYDMCVANGNTLLYQNKFFVVYRARVITKNNITIMILRHKRIPFKPFKYYHIIKYKYQPNIGSFLADFEFSTKKNLWFRRSVMRILLGDKTEAIMQCRHKLLGLLVKDILK